MMNQWPDSLSELNNEDGYTWLPKAGGSEVFKLYPRKIDDIETIESTIARLSDYGAKVHIDIVQAYRYTGTPVSDVHARSSTVQAKGDRHGVDRYSRSRGRTARAYAHQLRRQLAVQRIPVGRHNSARSEARQNHLLNCFRIVY
jgi:hypothetical protein